MEEGQRPKILIADDKEFILNNIDFILPDEKYQKFFANDGKECLSLVRELLPHLILLDINMPELDGFKVCKEVKRDPLTREIPIIFITGKNMPKEKSKGFSLGASDYLTKPLEEMELKARVTNLLKIKLEKDALNEKTEELGKALKASTDLLNNIKQAIFAFDGDMILKDPISKFSEKVFGQEIKGKNIYEVFFPEKSIKSNDYKNLEKTIKHIIGADSIGFSLSEDDLPQKIETVKEGGSKKVLQINYEPIFSDENKIEKIMCIVDDITTFDSYLTKLENDQLSYFFIKDFISIEDKDKFCFDLKTTIDHSVDILNKIVSPKEQEREEKFYTDLISEIIKQIDIQFANNPTLKERLGRPIIEFANWDSSEGHFELKSVEIISDILENLIRYARSANFIFPVKYSMDFSFNELIEEKLESIKNILKNLCQYTPGLEDLDSKKLSHVTKVIKMYPNLSETLFTVQQRSIFVSCLYRAQLDDEMSFLFKDFSSKLNQLSFKKEINERTIKMNLISPYKKISKHLEKKID